MFVPLTSNITLAGATAYMELKPMCEKYRTLSPNEALYLYGDDHEFTARFVDKGYPIYLVPKSLIKDLERSWH
jgi:hypothetical protein